MGDRRCGREIECVWVGGQGLGDRRVRVGRGEGGGGGGGMKEMTEVREG